MVWMIEEPMRATARSCTSSRDRKLRILEWVPFISLLACFNYRLQWRGCRMVCQVLILNRVPFPELLHRLIGGHWVVVDCLTMHILWCCLKLLVISMRLLLLLILLLLHIVVIELLLIWLILLQHVARVVLVRASNIMLAHYRIVGWLLLLELLSTMHVHNWWLGESLLLLLVLHQLKIWNLRCHLTRSVLLPVTQVSRLGSLSWCVTHVL